MGWKTPLQQIPQERRLLSAMPKKKPTRRNRVRKNRKSTKIPNRRTPKRLVQAPKKTQQKKPHHAIHNKPKAIKNPKTQTQPKNCEECYSKKGLTFPNEAKIDCIGKWKNTDDWPVTIVKDTAVSQAICEGIMMEDFA